MAFHSTVLTAEEVLTLYNSGKPQNLTQSAMAGSSSLMSWWRFGDHPDDDMTGYELTASSWQTGSGNVINDVKGGATLHFTVASQSSWPYTNFPLTAKPPLPAPSRANHHSIVRLRLLPVMQPSNCMTTSMLVGPYPNQTGNICGCLVR